MKPGRSATKLSQGKNSSFVLMVGDEGGILLHLQNKKVSKRIFAAVPEAEPLRAMDELLKANPKAPITMLVDMMDQSYVRQTLPPVSSFNVGKIVRRRLNKDFSADDIKGYVIFGREKKGRKDWNYLMASLAAPTLLQKWIDFLVERSNPFRGIGLVPLESQPLIKTIESIQQTKAGADKQATEWHILICHHKVGGFRQIVLRNGQLVFTRLAQLVGEPTPEVIAGNIEQEMLNTLEYLKRLGLQDASSLTATIVASSEIKESFEPKSIPAGQCHFYTPYEMAVLLSMEDVAKPEDHFADVVIAGFIGRRRKLLLTLFTAYTRKIAKLSKAIIMGRSVAACIMLAILGWAGMSTNDWLTASEATEMQRATKTSLDSEFAAETKKKQLLPEKINLYSDVATIFRYFERAPFDPLYFAHKLSGALGDIAIIKSYRWSLSPAIVSLKDEQKRQISADFESTLTVPQSPREEFVASAQKLVENIKQAFPNHDVNHTDLPGILSDTKELKTVINDSAGTASTTQSDALNTSIKFTVKGPTAKAAATSGQPPMQRGP